MQYPATSLQDARQWLATINLSEEEMARFYALYQRATGEKVRLYPSVLRYLFNNSVDRRAHDLFHGDYGDVTAQEAEKRYVALANRLVQQRLQRKRYP